MHYAEALAKCGRDLQPLRSRNYVPQTRENPQRVFGLMLQMRASQNLPINRHAPCGATGAAKTMIRKVGVEMNWRRFSYIFNTNFLYGAVFALIVLIIWNVVARFY